MNVAVSYEMATDDSVAGVFGISLGFIESIFQVLLSLADAVAAPRAIHRTVSNDGNSILTCNLQCCRLGLIQRVDV